MSLYQPQIIEPVIRKIEYSDCQIFGIQVYISIEEYNIASKSAQEMWANSKKGNYGRGLVNTNTDPFKVERVGRLGEIAFSKIFGVPVDLGYREGGDSYDFLLNGQHYDIKTRCQKYDPQVGMVYSFTGSGKPIPLKSDIYVFGLFEESILGLHTVFLAGYCTKEQLITLGPTKARRGSHYNYEIPFKNLSSILELYASIQDFSQTRKQENGLFPSRSSRITRPISSSCAEKK